MKLTIKIKDVVFEFEDPKADQVLRFHLEHLKVVINEVFENYKKLDL